MAEMTAILLGFVALILLTGGAFMYFLKMPLNTKDSEKVDPKP